MASKFNKIEQIISEGYEAINGHIFTASEAALYNRQCAFTSEAKEAASLNPSSIECRKSLETRLNLQYDLFKQITGMK